MVTGFIDIKQFAPIIGWELYQVTLDKYHAIFYFENGDIILDVASAFSHKSKDGTIKYTYDLYGSPSQFYVHRILRRNVTDISILSRYRLSLIFDNDDELVIHDNPNFCSWWFMPVGAPDEGDWYIGDEEKL